VEAEDLAPFAFLFSTSVLLAALPNNDYCQHNAQLIITKIFPTQM